MDFRKSNLPRLLSNWLGKKSGAYKQQDWALAPRRQAFSIRGISYREHP
jgi:hypothetical protein